MGITIEELKKLDKNTYQIIDIRDENEIAHGAIPGAVATPADSIEGNENIDFSKKLVICCSRGRFSVEVAEGLEEKGMDAVSLEGGYIAWLLDAMQQEEEVDICKDVELSIRKKFRKSIWCKFTKAINQYELVKPGDRIAVCISGGKDSMLMAKLFQELKIHNKFDFEVKFLVMDPGYSPANRKVIEENARKLNIPITIFESDIFDSVYNIEKSPCYLCARMRRGHLYHFAQELGCNKIALGHHYDDVIETILMGMLYGAQIQTMMPKLHSTNFDERLSYIEQKANENVLNNINDERYLGSIKSLFNNDSRLGVLIPPMKTFGKVSLSLSHSWANLNVFEKMKDKLEITVPYLLDKAPVYQINGLVCRKELLSNDVIKLLELDKTGTILQMIPLIAQEKGYYTKQVITKDYVATQIYNLTGMLSVLGEKISDNARNYSVREMTDQLMEEKIKYFLVSAKKVYIYGAGELACRVVEIAKKYCNLRGILVSDKRSNLSNIYGIQVMQYSELKYKDIDVIVAVGKKNNRNIERILKDDNIKNILYVD